MVQMYIHVCTFVHTFVFWEKIRPPTPKMVLLYRKIDKIGDFFKNSSKKIQKIWRIFQKNLENFEEFFNKNWENFRLSFPNLTYFLQFFGNFYENFVQKYQLYCDFGKNVDTHPWLYKSTLYTFVFWVPLGPTPPHTRRVLLYWLRRRISGEVRDPCRRPKVAS